MASANGVYMEISWTDEERIELAKQYGDLPKGEVFLCDLKSVLSWGKPWWRIGEILYHRNKKASEGLTEEDNISTWKALLFTTAEMLNKYSMPVRFNEHTCIQQWREDMFEDASSYLWDLIVVAGRGNKPLKTLGSAWLVIARIMHTGKVQKIPSGFNLEKFMESRKSYVVDPGEEAAANLDTEEDNSLLDSRVYARLSNRLPSDLYGKFFDVCEDVLEGRITEETDSMIARRADQLVTIHKRLVRNVLKNRRTERVERGYGSLLSVGN